MRLLITIFASLLCSLPFEAAWSQSPAPATLTTPDLSCSGDTHDQAIGLWKNALQKFFIADIQKGVVEHGDVYVMYNIQEYLQSFVEMTRRCKDRPQIAELVEALSPAFDALQALPNNPAARGWVCRGGNDCNSANKLINTEVQLCSIQFLGLIGALATDIVETIPPDQQSAAEKAFVSHTAGTIANQLDRWFSPEYFAQVATRAKMTPQDAKDGQSKYFFVDRDLWAIDLLSDLSELSQAGIVQTASDKHDLQSLQAKHQQITLLINFFLSRLTKSNTVDGARAEIDLGFWRNFGEFQYALYDGEQSPVVCDARGQGKKTVVVPKNNKYIDPTLGWDFSHARRLVPALGTLSRNRKNLGIVFGYKSDQLDPDALIKAFSNQIISKIWNKDSQYPLFSNYWNGKNGWYRAGYDYGTGCQQGQPPFYLSLSFLNGGYPEWSGVNENIRSLSIRLYQLVESDDPAAQAFIKKYYPSMVGPKNPNAANPRNTWMLAFTSSMVGH